MILNALGIVVSRRLCGEYDRLCCVFTEDLGKVPTRFVGVNRPSGKMKALSEPGVWGEYRLHLSPSSEFAKAVGGRLMTSFPALREDLGRTLDALACCEMLDRLTPERAPNPAKYRLICATLTAIEESPSVWLPPAFGLRLAERMGIGLRERVPNAARLIWEALHDEELAALARIPFDLDAATWVTRLLDEHFAVHTGRRLRSFKFFDAWDLAGKSAVPVS